MCIGACALRTRTVICLSSSSTRTSTSRLALTDTLGYQFTDDKRRVAVSRQIGAGTPGATSDIANELAGFASRKYRRRAADTSPRLLCNAGDSDRIANSSPEFSTCQCALGSGDAAAFIRAGGGEVGGPWSPKAFA